MANDKTALTNILTEHTNIKSAFLDRDVLVDVYLPVNVEHPEQMNLLLINDGQDLPNMPFDEMLDDLIAGKQIYPLVCVGIHCGPERKMEYGSIVAPDFKGRGARAPQYQQFIFEELLPYIRETYNVPSFKEKSFAGFSLGGLSALDIVWNNPAEFSKAGIFSGSLWWRNKSYKDGYDDTTDRIMHQQVRNGTYNPWLKFFFECGLLDETKDRNKNGIIDSIDDTIDLMQELKNIGYPDENIQYLLLEDGRHDVPTWARAFPDFLKWGWGIDNGK